MGKQINYYMGYKDFLSVAQTALDNGAVIYRHERRNGKMQMIGGTSLEIVKEDTVFYYFHFPTSGELIIEDHYGNQHPSHSSALHLIEAGFSSPDHENRLLRSNRLYLITGRYENGIWIPRSENIGKCYSKLVRIVKRIAPYTEIEHYVVNEMYKGEKYITKEYITPEFFILVKNNDYTLG